jgi:hypothetical protein
MNKILEKLSELKTDKADITRIIQHELRSFKKG